MSIMASAESWERLLRTGEGKVVFPVLVVIVVVGVVDVVVIVVPHASGCRLRKTSSLLGVVMVQLFWRSRLSNMSSSPFLFLSRKCGKKGDPGGSDMGDAKLRGECGMPVAVDMVIMRGGGGWFVSLGVMGCCNNRGGGARGNACCCRGDGFFLCNVLDRFDGDGVRLAILGTGPKATPLLTARLAE